MISPLRPWLGDVDRSLNSLSASGRMVDGGREGCGIVVRRGFDLLNRLLNFDEKPGAISVVILVYLSVWSENFTIRACIMRHEAPWRFQGLVEWRIFPLEEQRFSICKTHLYVFECGGHARPSLELKNLTANLAHAKAHSGFTRRSQATSFSDSPQPPHDPAVVLSRVEEMGEKKLARLGSGRRRVVIFVPARLEKGFRQPLRDLRIKLAEDICVEIVRCLAKLTNSAVIWDGEAPDLALRTSLQSLKRMFRVVLSLVSQLVSIQICAVMTRGGVVDVVCPISEGFSLRRQNTCSVRPLRMAGGERGLSSLAITKSDCFANHNTLNITFCSCPWNGVASFPIHVFDVSAIRTSNRGLQRRHRPALQLQAFTGRYFRPPQRYARVPSRAGLFAVLVTRSR
ncbi:uncharacterized protein BDR25DRAFT_349197 [Lindgomyces ingoldianus]|uniref:Uncharacterized protein n=1 Tax=Lindgomyces ingoldianus TaxID=673940 RepID=A0ACB6RDN7_9PLEO|nr:uncharacterized protein BDR25DRAFT_349197 [Lindgomyces ingoldianus]KAF2477251.1 hypothetical protein BDR25DRAFT_349197 [Lindgomyces ingoldianus]